MELEKRIKRKKRENIVREALGFSSMGHELEVVQRTIPNLLARLFRAEEAVRKEEKECELDNTRAFLRTEMQRIKLAQSLLATTYWDDIPCRRCGKDGFHHARPQGKTVPTINGGSHIRCNVKEEPAVQCKRCGHEWSEIDVKENRH